MIHNPIPHLIIFNVANFWVPLNLLQSYTILFSLHSSISSLTFWRDHSALYTFNTNRHKTKTLLLKTRQQYTIAPYLRLDRGDVSYCCQLVANLVAPLFVHVKFQLTS